MSTDLAPPPPPAAPAKSSGDGLDALANQMYSAAPAADNAAPSKATFEMQPMETAPQKPAAEAPVVPEKKEKKTFSIHDKLTEKKADAAPATAPDTDPFSHIAPEKDMSEKSLTGWKALKTEATSKLRAAQQEAADAKAQLETFRKASPADTAEIERLKQEHKALLDKVAVLDVQNHPDFTRQYVEPKKKALSEAVEVLSYNGKDSVDVAALLGKSPKDFAAAVSEITKEMNQMDATTVQTSLRSAYKLAAEEKSALSNSSQLKEQIAQREAQRAKQAFEETFNSLELKDGLFSPIEIPEDAEDNEKVEIQRINEAFTRVRAQAEANVFGKLTEQQVAKLGVKAALHDVHMNTVIPRMNTEHQKVLRQLEAVLKENKLLKSNKNPGSFAGDSGNRAAPSGKMSLDALATQMFSQTP